MICFCKVSSDVVDIYIYTYETKQRGSYLNAIDMFEWPFNEVLGRFLSVSFPLVIMQFVLTITFAIPLFPSQVKWLLMAFPSAEN